MIRMEDATVGFKAGTDKGAKTGLPREPRSKVRAPPLRLTTGVFNEFPAACNCTPKYHRPRR
jgi:hypothetical protein